MKVKITNGSGQSIEADIVYGKMTDTVSIEAPLLGLFTITGDSARNLKACLNTIVPDHK